MRCANSFDPPPPQARSGPRPHESPCSPHAHPRGDEPIQRPRPSAGARAGLPLVISGQAQVHGMAGVPRSPQFRRVRIEVRNLLPPARISSRAVQVHDPFRRPDPLEGDPPEHRGPGSRVCRRNRTRARPRWARPSPRRAGAQTRPTLFPDGSRRGKRKCFLPGVPGRFPPWWTAPGLPRASVSLLPRTNVSPPPAGQRRAAREVPVVTWPGPIGWGRESSCGPTASTTAERESLPISARPRSDDAPRRRAPRSRPSRIVPGGEVDVGGLVPSSAEPPFHPPRGAAAGRRCGGSGRMCSRFRAAARLRCRLEHAGRKGSWARNPTRGWRSVTSRRCPEKPGTPERPA